VTGGHVWSERYDGQVEDVFDLQVEITRNVVASIQTVVQLNAISEPLERTARPELTVWELTMRSWRLLYECTQRPMPMPKPSLNGLWRWIPTAPRPTGYFH